MKDSADNYVLLTGASGDIGSSICKLLLESQYRVIAQYNGSTKHNKALADHAVQHQTSIEFIQADFADSTSLKEFVEAVTNKRHIYHATIHCAGVNEKKQYRDVTEEDFERIFSVNTKAPFFLTQALMKTKSLKKNAAILFMGTPYSFIGGSMRNMLYTGSKTTLLAWHKNLAKELAPNVRVNTVVPGHVDSKMLREKNNAEALGKRRADIPYDRFATPGEIAQAVLRAISDEASYVTGQSIHVNGGLVLT